MNKSWIMGGGIVVAGVAAILVIKNRVVIQRAAEQAGFPGFQFPVISSPEINWGNPIWADPAGDAYAPYNPCACGCGALDVAGSDFITPAEEGLKGVQIGSSSAVPESGNGLASRNLTTAIYFGGFPSSTGAVW